jgi:hypothetical protein
MYLQVLLIMQVIHMRVLQVMWVVLLLNTADYCIPPI